MEKSSMDYSKNINFSKLTLRTRLKNIAFAFWKFRKKIIFFLANNSPKEKLGSKKFVMEEFVNPSEFLSKSFMNPIKRCWGIETLRDET